MNGPGWKEILTADFGLKAASTLDDWQLDEKVCKEILPLAMHMREAYKEAVKALRGAVIEEEYYLDTYSSELDPEYKYVLREQIKEHNKILDKCPEEE